jgi:hypothetical protein
MTLAKWNGWTITSVSSDYGGISWQCRTFPGRTQGRRLIALLMSLRAIVGMPKAIVHVPEKTRRPNGPINGPSLIALAGRTGPKKVWGSEPLATSWLLLNWTNQAGYLLLVWPPTAFSHRCRRSGLQGRQGWNFFTLYWLINSIARALST